MNLFLYDLLMRLLRAFLSNYVFILKEPLVVQLMSYLTRDRCVYTCIILSVIYTVIVHNEHPK